MESLTQDPVSTHTLAEQEYLRNSLDPSEIYYSRTLDYPSNEEEFREDVQLLRALSYFDIKVVPFEAKVVELPGGSTEYRINAIKVEGTTDPDMDDPQVASDYDDLCVALAGYLYDRVSQGKPFLVDLCKATQFVYGSYDGAEKPEFVLVDLDLMETNDPELALHELEMMVEDFVVPVVSRHPEVKFHAPQMVKEVLAALTEVKDLSYVSEQVKQIVQSLDVKNSC
jgi:hypothetical protein